MVEYTSNTLTWTRGGENLIIDSQDTIGKNFEKVDLSLRATLVKRNSAEGAVRVFGDDIRHVVTGPKENGFVIVSLSEAEYC